MTDGLRVIVQSLQFHPACEHGPALLFERQRGSKHQTFYACSAYRDQKECSLYVLVDNNKKREPNQDALAKNVQKSAVMAAEKSELMKKVLNQSPRERIYCHNCHTFLTGASDYHLQRNHAIQRGITNEQIERPTTFLRSLSNDKREAQYFFSDASLDCFVRIFQGLKINKIVCIGAPRLHEHLKCLVTKLGIKSILLDLDTRFYTFCNRGGKIDFFHYNMFNNYFFAGPEAETKFHDFLRDENNDKCCIFTDPPFGCRTEALIATLHALSQNYRRMNESLCILPIFWVFPYFMEMYITSLMPEMEMLDYKVNYTNHDTYHDGKDGRKQGSPVRLFTNVPNHLIELPREEDYRFCKKCNKWVARENEHCDRCKTCPSKNGSTYVHCRLCELCVKPTYKHCNNCWRCTQIEHHDCIKYQSQLRCMICLQRGHNEADCIDWFKRCRKSVKEITALKSKAIQSGRRICFLCFKSGHKEQSCLQRKQLLQEESFLNECYNLLTQEMP